VRDICGHCSFYIKVDAEEQNYDSISVLKIFLFGSHSTQAVVKVYGKLCAFNSFSSFQKFSPVPHSNGLIIAYFMTLSLSGLMT
jgi:hypothetical protein